MIAYKIKYTTSFKKQLKKVLKQGKNMEKMLNIVDKLSKKQELDPLNKDHMLINNKYYQNCRECHIEPDWLLIYKYDENASLLYLVETGSHSELFNK